MLRLLVSAVLLLGLATAGVYYYQTYLFDPEIPCSTVLIGSTSDTSVRLQVFLPLTPIVVDVDVGGSKEPASAETTPNRNDAAMITGQFIDDAYQELALGCMRPPPHIIARGLAPDVIKVKALGLYSPAHNRVMAIAPLKYGRDKYGGNRIIKFDGLPSNTTFRVVFLDQFQIDGASVVFRANAFITTFPDKNKSEDIKIVFGSCTQRSVFPYHKLKAYETILALKPRFLLLLGDNIYTDLHEYVPEYRIPFDRAHRQVLADLDVRKVLARIPNFSMFDDHEIENDFTGGRLHRFADEGLKAWNFYWGRRNPDPILPPLIVIPKDNIDGNDNDIRFKDERYEDYYYTFSYGATADVFMSQSRLNLVAHRTLLGEKQKAHLKQFLLDSQEMSKADGMFRIKIIASPVSWSHDGHGDLFIEERKEILCFIERNRIEGVIILSGDMHWGAAYQYHCPDPDPEHPTIKQKKKIVTEFSASPFQALPFPYSEWPEPGSPEVLDHDRILFSWWAFHFGELDLSPSTRSVTFNLHTWSVLPVGIPKVSATIKVKFATSRDYFMSYQDAEVDTNPQVQSDWAK